MYAIIDKIKSYFKINERNSSIKTEVIAGFTSFIVISYVIIVNIFSRYKVK